eukprot:6177766-Pleurochrysis_carterae.AAC.1
MRTRREVRNAGGMCQRWWLQMTALPMSSGWRWRPHPDSETSVAEYMWSNIAQLWRFEHRSVSEHVMWQYMSDAHFTSSPPITLIRSTH